MKIIAVFIVQLLYVYLVWRFTTEHNKRDFVFLVYGLFIASMCSSAVGSQLTIALRHFIPYMAFFAIIFRKDLIKSNFGWMLFAVLMMVVMRLVSTSWSAYPKIFFEARWMTTVFCVCSLLMASSLGSERDLEKLIWAALPHALVLSVGMHFGIHDIVGDDDRLSINEMNQNAVGAYAGFAVVVLTTAFTYLKSLRFLRILIPVFIFSALMILLKSGSRTATLSALGCCFIGLFGVFKGRHLFKIGLPIFVILLVVVFFAWNKIDFTLATRLTTLSDLSTRDMVWDEAFYRIVKDGKWFGVGTIQQGWIVMRKEWEGLIAPGSMLNIYLDVIFELGVIGVLLWMIYFIAMIYSVRRMMRSTNSIAKFIPLAFCVYGMMQGIGENMPMKGFHPISIIFFCGVAMLSAKNFVWHDDWRNAWKRR